jgi:hypothetical protein
MTTIERIAIAILITVAFLEIWRLRRRVLRLEKPRRWYDQVTGMSIAGRVKKVEQFDNCSVIAEAEVHHLDVVPPRGRSPILIIDEVTEEDSE